jgi:hypothetical protein
VNKRSFRIVFVALLTASVARAAPRQNRQPQAVPAPLADHHQHLFSPALAALISPPPPAAPVRPIDADSLILLLDAAGIRRAAVLSVAYIYGQPGRNVENEYEKVKAENDWTSQQVTRYRNRLRGFCGLNPLKDYALVELARCAKDTNLRYGLKLHFGNSAVDYHNPQHVAFGNLAYCASFTDLMRRRAATLRPARDGRSSSKCHYRMQSSAKSQQTFRLACDSRNSAPTNS